MIAKKTRRYLEMAMGNVSHSDRELQEEVKKELCELEEASEKQTPKKPKYEPHKHLYLCPNCKEYLITYNEKQNYSMCCGQKLDWS